MNWINPCKEPKFKLIISYFKPKENPKNKFTHLSKYLCIS